MTGPKLPPTAGLGCGCGGSLAFLAVIGLPVLFVFSFGMSPCQDGPCSPNGARDFNIVALALLACAALIFTGLRQFARSRKRRQLVAAQTQDGPQPDGR